METYIRFFAIALLSVLVAAVPCFGQNAEDAHCDEGSSQSTNPDSYSISTPEPTGPSSDYSLGDQYTGNNNDPADYYEDYFGGDGSADDCFSEDEAIREQSCELCDYFGIP